MDQVFQIDGFLWLLLMLGPFLILQRQIHFEIQAFFLLLTRRPDVSMVLFSLLFFPGIAIHELSHFLVARLLGVRTGSFSLVPRNLGDGRLQLGYVVTASSDVLRDSLIGAAPLLFGGLAVAYIARARLGFDNLVLAISSPGFLNLTPALDAVFHAEDFWLWFYLLFAINSTMLPSASDRRAWVPLAGIFLVLLSLAFLLGVGPWLLRNLEPALNSALRALAVVFGMSALTHLVLLLPIWVFRRILNRLTGLKVGR